LEELWQWRPAVEWFGLEVDWREPAAKMDRLLTWILGLLGPSAVNPGRKIQSRP